VSDRIITNGTTVSGEQVDIEIREGTIRSVLPAGEGDPDEFDPDQRTDAGGRVVTPTLVEPHCHLDHVLTAGRPRWNESGTLREGGQLWTELRDDLERQDVVERASRVVEWFLANGVTRLRSHVSVTTAREDYTNLEALLDVKAEYADLVDIQLALTPSDRLDTDRKVDIFRRAFDIGGDVVGGLPGSEHTPEGEIEHVERLFEVAIERDLPIDVHIDESDDPSSRMTEVLADKALTHGVGDRTTASHATAMHSYPNEYATALTHHLAESDLSVVTNPLSNAVLQGRHDDYPRRRGHTRIQELRGAGVPVGIGQDNILDHFNMYGDGDPLTAAHLLAHYAHMNARDHVSDIWEMLVSGNAEVYGVEGHGLAEGAAGSVVVYDGYDAFDVLRTRAPRIAVVRHGDVIAETNTETTLHRSTGSRAIDYGR